MASPRSSSPADSSTRRRPTSSLALRPQPGRPLNKKQQAFNRLVTAVERARARLDAARRRFDAALVFHAEHVRPRVGHVIAARKDLVRALQPFLDDRRLKRSEKQELRTMLAEQLDGVLQGEAELDDDLRALFEELHGASMAELEQEEMDDTRAVMEGMFADMGLTIDLSEFHAGMSEEDVAAKAAAIWEEARHQIDETPARIRSGRRKTKRQIREDERVRQLDELRKTNIGAIYRRLAKVLHPDLEPDPDNRHRKSALMQEVTAAYASKDLHTLLRLELEWIHREENAHARMTDEKLDAYSQLLRDQVADLEAEAAALPYSPKYQPLVQEVGPFGVGLLLDGDTEVRRLDDVAAGLLATLASLKTEHAFQEVRDAIKVHRRVMRDVPF
jgi:hypothetical protein